MNLRALVYQSYQTTVALAQIPDELKRALKTHERVPRFVNNLVKELEAVPDLKKTTIIDTVTSLTNVFLSNIQRKAEVDQMSALKKLELQKQAERAEEFKKAAETGIVSEEFLENE